LTHVRRRRSIERDAPLRSGGSEHPPDTGAGQPALASRWTAYEPGGPSGNRPAGLEIRHAKPDDCSAIAAMEASRDGAASEPARRRCMEQAADPETILLVAFVDGHVVGFARAGRLRPATDAAQEASVGGLTDGWYLIGLVVVDAWRRRGIGRALTEARLDWIAERADAAYYFVNARNRASIDLHRELGFVEISRRFSAPGVTFEGGRGLLYRLDLGR
jgi:ribosomal protein S18 acetylase RimI-like enzyme